MKVKDKVKILITNDDGIQAKGIESLIDIMKPFGEITVVAPEQGQSGMGHAITVKYPIRVINIAANNGIKKYSCNGTPVDCVKIAIHEVMKELPDFVISGINHGANSSASIFYSGTMAAAIEGCLNNIPSIAFSLGTYEADADFSHTEKYVKQVFENTLIHGLPQGVCLNVNIPKAQPKGIKVCRQTKGFWQEEFVKRQDPAGRSYFWLTGTYQNFEPESIETDEWALTNNYVSIVPVHLDLTAHHEINRLNEWNWQ